MTAKTCPPVAERIAYIVEMMRALKWVRGKSAVKLADEWQIALSTVEGHSAEARRIVYAETIEPEMVTIKACTLLEQVMDEAMADSRADDPMRDPNKSRAIVISAARQWSEITGAKAPTRIENINVDAKASTPAEAKRIMRELFASGVTPPDAPDIDSNSGKGEPGEGAPSE